MMRWVQSTTPTTSDATSAVLLDGAPQCEYVDTQLSTTNRYILATRIARHEEQANKQQTPLDSAALGSAEGGRGSETPPMLLQRNAWQRKYGAPLPLSLVPLQCGAAPVLARRGHRIAATASSTHVPNVERSGKGSNTMKKNMMTTRRSKGSNDFSSYSSSSDVEPAPRSVSPLAVPLIRRYR